MSQDVHFGCWGDERPVGSKSLSLEAGKLGRFFSIRKSYFLQVKRLILSEHLKNTAFDPYLKGLLHLWVKLQVLERLQFLFCQLIYDLKLFECHFVLRAYR